MKKTSPDSDTVVLDDLASGPSDKDTVVNWSAPEPGLASDGLAVGSVLKNRFVLESVLGEGGMGIIFKARDRLKEEMNDRKIHIAIKVLNERLKGNNELLVALQREARKSQELAHPNIINVYDFDRDGDHVFMTMEFLDGKTLKDVLNQADFKDCSLARRWSMIRGIARGLAYAHEKKVIHYDIKPGNIFVCDDGTVKVLDFGIAKAMRTPLEEDRTVFDEYSPEALTPPYASPEMLSRGVPDYRDDVYALACVAYEILSGRHPFKKLPAVQAAQRAMTPEPIKGLSSKQWKGICQGLAFDRGRRIASVEKFLYAIENGDHGGSLKGWMVFFGGLAAAGVALWGWQASQTQSVAPLTRTPQPIVESKRSMPERTPLTDAETQVIDDLLEIAPLHFAMGRIADPPGSNAMDAYQRILAIDPQHTQALLGLEQSVHACERSARKKLEEDDLETASRLVETCLRARPDHNGLQDLRQRLAEAE